MQGRLLRVLGLGFGLAVTIGNTIGAGIFRSPGEVASRLPDPSLFLLAWVAGGAYALVCALQIAELGTMIPRSAGQYVFSRRALGDYAGFVVGWSDWLSTCGTTAAVAIVVGEFANALMPGLIGGSAGVALVVTIAFAAAQWRGVRTGSAVQNVTSLLKVIAFAILIASAFAFQPSPGSAAEMTVSAVRVDLALAAAFLLALQPVIYTYDGWAAIVYFSEEVEQPERNVLRTLMAGLILIISIYLLTNLALLHVLPISRMAGDEFAAGTAARVIFGRSGDAIFRTLTIVSLLSAVNANHLMATRVLFSMSRDGLFPARAAVVNAGGTPTATLLVSAAVAVLFVIFGRTFRTVIAVLAFFFVAQYALSFTSLFVLRRREPDAARPYRAWGYPWTTAAALAASAAFLAGAVAGDTRNSVYAVALLAVSYPVFRFIRRPHAAPGA